MLVSIDCLHWEWKNCPIAWRGQYTRGDYSIPTIILEAVASHDLWIWHAFFGIAGSNNDINVLNQSTLFTKVLQGNAPPVEYFFNEKRYNMGSDGIYLEWAVVVKDNTSTSNREGSIVCTTPRRDEEACRTSLWSHAVMF